MTQARLHIAGPIGAGGEIRLADERAHYLRNVLRLREGELVRLFNAEDGEWAARLVAVARHAAVLRLLEQVRAPVPEPGPTLVFAPIRRNRLDWLVEKAVELGVARLVPVITRRTVVKPEGADRLAAIAREAAEQCERLSVPPVMPPTPFAAWLAARDPHEPVLVALTRTEAVPLARALRVQENGRAMTFLIGPEGGFADDEREQLRAAPGVWAVSLGTRILRTETAALAMLAAASLDLAAAAWGNTPQAGLQAGLL